MKISLCMIIKDEEKYIADCLNSAKVYCDEIIIVDTGSSDRSIDICQKYTSKIYNYKWNNDFSAARNFSIDKAGGDWILVLDADEILKISSAIELTEFLKKLPQNIFGLQFKIINIAENNLKIDINPETVTRLFRNDSRINFARSIHESVNDSIQAINMSLGHAPWHIEHCGYLKNIDNLNKSQNYLKAILAEIEKNPHDWKYYGFAAIEYDKLADFDNEEKMLLKALSLLPDSPEIIFKLGLFYAARKNDCIRAVSYFTKLENDSIFKLESLLNMTKCCLASEDFISARDYFEKIFRLSKDSEEIILLGLAIFRKLNTGSKIIYLLNRLIQIRRKPEYYFELTGRYIEAGNKLKAKKILSEGLTFFADDEKLEALKNNPLFDF